MRDTNNQRWSIVDKVYATAYAIVLIVSYTIGFIVIVLPTHERGLFSRTAKISAAGNEYPWFKMLNNWGNLILFLVVLFVGIHWLMTILRNMALGYASMGWSTVNGTIVSTDMESYADIVHGQWIVGRRAYQTKVRYEYEVNKMPYVSSRIRFGRHIGNNWNEKTSRETIDRYIKGGVVKVYYTKQDPSLSALQPGIHKRDFWDLFIALTAIGISLWFFSLFPQLF